MTQDKIQTEQLGFDATGIPCGCGDYELIVPTKKDIPIELNAVCPECENHFGYGGEE